MIKDSSFDVVPETIKNCYMQAGFAVEKTNDIDVSFDQNRKANGLCGHLCKNKIIPSEVSFME